MSSHLGNAKVAKGSKVHDGQSLPKKEADIFRNILKLYERKEYKKGLKSAETILNKYPEHGETLSMKGLLLNCLDRKEEATEFARKGLLKNLKSHVCWHLYGLIHRSDHNYGEAVKCYLNALKHDPENLQILRDLSLLQVHIRDINGYVETRRKILALKSNVRANWTSYAIALHFACSYDTATKVLDAFYGTLDADREITYEDSELILYRTEIVAEGGKLEEALKLLDESKDKIKDDESFQMMKAWFLLNLRSFEQAEDIYRNMLDYEPENYVVHRYMQCAVLRLQSGALEAVRHEEACGLPCTGLCLDESQLLLLKETYKNLMDVYPKSPAICQILLSMSEGNEFATLLAKYLKGMLAKGIPVLGADLDSLYIFPKFCTAAKENYSPRQCLNCQRKDDTAAAEMTTKKMELDHPKAKTLLDTCDTFIKSLRETKRFSGDDDSSPTQSSEVEMWAMYLKSEVLEKVGRLKESLALAEECINLAPTVIEVIRRKAHVLKKMGAYSHAADVMESARTLDPSDRYLNNKTAKYFLRADRVADAETTMTLFTVHEDAPQTHLFEMQCNWYELEWAESQLRKGNLHLCLKKAYTVVNHFEEFVEDQFDFHSYCMRKDTLIAYTGMLRMMDKIQGHRFFIRAAALIVKCYLSIFDHPPEQTCGVSSPDDCSNMTSAERKKAKQKAKKEEKRKLLEDQKRREALEAAALKAAPAKQHHDGAGAGDGKVKTRGAPKKTRKPPKPVPIDPDPEGFLLAQKDPLKEAAKMVSILALQAPSNLETWLLGFDVAIRRGKWLMALRALCHSRECTGSIDNVGPAVMSRVAQFFNALSKADETPTAEFGEHVGTVILDAKVKLLNGLDIPSYVEKLVDKCTSLPEYVEASRCVMSLFGDSDRAIQLITEGLQMGRGLIAKSCHDALIAMKELGLPEEDISAFQLKFLELHPLGSAFGAEYNPENQAVQATTNDELNKLKLKNTT